MLRICCYLLFLLIGLIAASDPFPGASQPCYDEQRNGVQGFCESTSCCEGNFYISNLCPDYPAASLSNIKDTCYGKGAKRSAYGVAPGGCVCLKESMLQTMYDYATQFWNTYKKPIEINAIAGSEHSSNSWHYQGNTMDVACTSPINHCKALENFCRSRGAIELCFPGSNCGGHETWVHCAMPV